MTCQGTVATFGTVICRMRAGFALWLSSSWPWQPAEGHRFNPAKLLIDPCARQIDGEFKDNPLLHAGHNEPDYRDNAAIAPKCVVVIDHYDWEDDAPPRTPWGSTIIYEAHVKGLTYLHRRSRSRSVALIKPWGIR